MKNLLAPVLIATFLTSLLSYCVGYYNGYNNSSFENEKKLDLIRSTDLGDFFANSSYKYLEGYKLDLPEEIKTLSWYDEPDVDLLVSFIDDSGDIHFKFTGQKMPREDLIRLLDREDMDKDIPRASLIDSNSIMKQMSYKY